jgi:dTDP-4-dehydrorhamnose 3,5-epimerase
MQKFNFSKTEIEGVYLVKPFAMEDERGNFIKDYSYKVFSENKILHELKEVFYTISTVGVIRGIHFQRTKQQAKLVRCVSGKIYDVIVDLRISSPTFGKWQGFTLSAENMDSLYVPGGCGHGYLVLEDSVVSYKCDEDFYGEYDDGIIYNDADLAINWQIKDKEAIILSEKDKNLQTFKEFIRKYGGLKGTDNVKTAIITGAMGFIGKQLTKNLAEKGFRVFALSRGTVNKADTEQIKYIQLDMEGINKLAEKNISADIFYHLAWHGSAGTERNNVEIQLKNIQWTVDALNLCKQIGCKRFVCAGSIMEKEASTAALEQGSKPGLAYIYGVAKLAAHAISKAVAADLGIDHIWARITNVYGAGEISPRFINSTLRKILNNEPLRFTSATQNYDFVYIDDAAEAFYRIGEYGRAFNEYTIGSSTAKPLKEFIVEMATALCPEKELIFGDVPFTGVNLPLEDYDCSITERDTGFKAQIPFSEGVKKTMEWLKASVLK